MKKRKSIPKISHVLCAFLVMLAPVIVNQSACLFLYGEPECPDSLK